MTAVRIYTSEGDQTERPAMSQWQRERARGQLQPMATLPVSHREARWTCAIVALSTVVVAVVAAVRL